MKIEQCIITKFGRTCINSRINIKNLYKIQKFNDYFVGYILITISKIILQDIHDKSNNSINNLVYFTNSTFNE